MKRTSVVHKPFQKHVGKYSKRASLPASLQENANNLLLTFIKHILAQSIALNAHRDGRKKQCEGRERKFEYQRRSKSQSAHFSSNFYVVVE